MALATLATVSATGVPARWTTLEARVVRITS